MAAGSVDVWKTLLANNRRSLGSFIASLEHCQDGIRLNGKC
jgi:hypothetical protein